MVLFLVNMQEDLPFIQQPLVHCVKFYLFCWLQLGKCVSYVFICLSWCVNCHHKRFYTSNWSGARIGACVSASRGFLSCQCLQKDICRQQSDCVPSVPRPIPFRSDLLTPVAGKLTEFLCLFKRRHSCLHSLSLSHHFCASVKKPAVNILEAVPGALAVVVSCWAQ